jgi:hypothetical protein
VASAAGPAIYAVSSPGVIHDGEAVTWSVATSRDVIAVSGHVSVYNFPFTSAGGGRFFVSFSVPADVPPLFHGTYSMNVIARSRSGATAERTVNVTFQ